MGMSTHVIGFKPADEKFTKMLAVWDACLAVGLHPPEEVTEYFGTAERREVDARGVTVSLSHDPSVTRWRDGSSDGYEVDMRKLDLDIKIIRFYNSW
jgi:hypothetical protein